MNTLKWVMTCKSYDFSLPTTYSFILSYLSTIYNQKLNIPPHITFTVGIEENDDVSGRCTSTSESRSYQSTSFGCTHKADYSIWPGLININPEIA